MFSKKLLILAFAALLLPACATGPVDATYNYEIVEMDDFQLPWTGCLLDQQTGQPLNPECEPSPPVIVRLDARVRDSLTNIPANNVRIWFNSAYSDAYLLPPEVLEAIEIPSGGNWDTVTNQGEVWAEFSGTWDGNYRPTYFEGWTDKNGLASAFLFVNTMPTNPTGQPIQMTVTVSTASDTEIILFQGGA